MKLEIVYDGDLVRLHAEWLGGTARLVVGTTEQYAEVLKRISQDYSLDTIAKNTVPSKALNRHLAWFVLKYTLFRGDKYMRKDKLIKRLSKLKTMDTPLSEL